MQSRSNRRSSNSRICWGAGAGGSSSSSLVSAVDASEPGDVGSWGCVVKAVLRVALRERKDVSRLAAKLDRDHAPRLLEWQRFKRGRNRFASKLERLASPRLEHLSNVRPQLILFDSMSIAQHSAKIRKGAL